MTKTRTHLIILGALLVLLAAGTASAARLQHDCKGAGGNCAETGVVPGAAVLYDQTDAATGNGAPDQAFEAAYAAYNAEGADDFEVTDAAGWDITGLTTLGSSGTNGAAFVNISFYADDAGAPAATAVTGCSFVGVTDFANNLGDLQINLPTCNLTPGTYWVSQTVRQDFGAFGQHFWSDRSAQSGSGAVWRNPADGFGAGCLDWTNKLVCGVGSSSGPDFLFQVIGEVRSSQGGGGVPALGPLGMLLTVLALGGGSGYVLSRRRRS